MNNEALLAKAQNVHKIGQYSEAEKLYLELYKNDFEPEKILSALTNVCILSGAIERVEGYLFELTKRFPTKISYCEALANLYANSNNWAAAASCYAMFIKHNPNYADGYYNHAFNLKRAAKYKEAIVNYQLALDRNISKPEEVLTNMAVIYSENLRLETKAKDCLESALDASSSYIPAMFNLATLYEEEGNRDSAIEYYQKILKLNSNENNALVRLAEAQRVDNSNSKIIQQLKEALNNCIVSDPYHPDIISLNFALGKVFDDCEQYDDAFKYYSEANNLDKKIGIKYKKTDHEQLIKDNVTVFTQEWFSNLTPVSDAEPIFICGMFRSGSTLLEQVLASHSKITAGGERDFFVRLENEMIKPYPFGAANLIQNDLQKIANDYLSDLTTAFPNSVSITDKRPDNFLYLGLIKTLFPRAKILHTKRNSLDNCLSVYFLRADSTISYAKNLDHIGHFYTQYKLLMTHWQSLFGHDIYEISYDDLVANPEVQIRAVLDYLNLDWEADCLNFHSIQNRVKTASIWQVRQPFYQNSSGRSSNYISHIKPLIESLDV